MSRMGQGTPRALRGGPFGSFGWPVVACCALFVATATPGHGAEERGLSLKEFARITVLANGRKMPLDSYARINLLQLSGRQRHGKESALAWLARAIFDPESVLDDRFIRIDNPEIADAVGVERDDHRRYGFRELAQGYSQENNLVMVQRIAGIDDKERTPFEKEFFRTYNNMVSFSHMMSTYLFADPHRDFAASEETLATLGIETGGNPLSALQMLRHIDAIRSHFPADHQSGMDNLAGIERDVFQLVANLYSRRQASHGQNLPFEVIPYGNEEAADWMSPWQATLHIGGDPGINEELNLLEAMRHAYRSGRQLEFDRAVRDFRKRTSLRAGPGFETRYPSLELLYNRANPFLYAKFWYALAFLVSLASLAFWERRCLFAATILIAVGLAFHTTGLLSRMLIMGRPPVTNLYATFLFVSWICVLLGVALMRFGRRSVGALLASLAGFALLMLSGKFATEGDTMGVLVAVLDSNFWLATHVVTITIGYAGCCAAGVVGHIYILQALFGKKDRARLRGTYQAMFGMLAFGLIFSAVGTILGGIWADQSWGRFWGWDPKENGALMIVLWCALLFHARLSGMVREIGLAAGTIIGIFMVVLAWFGINLLGVGLHSYGFTSGTAVGMLVFFVAETIFMAITVPLARRRMA